MKPTKAQESEFWEWCGFKKIIPTNKPFKFGWEYPSPSLDFTNLLPDIDLNNLFEFAVPKLPNTDVVSLEQGLWSIHIHDTAESKAYWVNQPKGCDDLALALFWAIYEIIKEQK